MNKGLLGLLFVWVIGITVFLVYPEKKSTIYVNLDQVYQEFEMTKELTVKYDGIKESRQVILDSLELKAMKYEPTSDDYKALASLYANRQNEFSGEIERIGEQYDLQIWKQINEYVKSYGDYNSIEYIFGTRGNGNIMYGNEVCNKTKDVIKYLNDKYAGH